MLSWQELESPPPVLTKADFVSRYIAKEFGNMSPTWATLPEFMGRMEEFKDGLFHLRNRVAGGETHYKQTAKEIVGRWASKEWRSQWYCSMQVPVEVEKTLLIQGEIQQAHPGSGRCGLELYYSRVPKPMREALVEEAQQTSGIVARILLNHYLCPNSLTWLEVLLRRYPAHCIEFSAFRIPWGTLPNHNVVWWEVRSY